MEPSSTLRLPTTTLGNAGRDEKEKFHHHKLGRGNDDEGSDAKGCARGALLRQGFLERCQRVYPESPKEAVKVRYDADMLAWFKAQGRGYQTRMNAVLRSYYEAHRDGPTVKR